MDVSTLIDGITNFYFSFDVLAAVVGTVPGALVERKTCATLERFHFVLFYFVGAAVLGYLYFEIVRSLSAENVWKAQLGMSLVAGLYLGNVAARRLRNAAKHPILALLMWVPVVNIAFWVALALIPTAPKKNQPAVTS
ncbi:hypothetical protein [Magnetovibrio sp.]|uniref:hypothetical protein n=1 Tax=Magnetovibrio sp. TaxID=2024836 RepID=UPI002F956F59